MPLNDAQRQALVAVRHGQVWTNGSYRSRSPRDSTAARSDLRGLVDVGLAVAHGDRGGRAYSLAPLRTGSTTAHPCGRSAPDEPARPREDDAGRIVAVLASGPAGTARLTAQTGLTGRQVGYALDLLRDQGRVELDGRRGVRGSVYRLIG